MTRERMVNIHIVQRIKGPRPPNCDMFLFLVVQWNVLSVRQEQNEPEDLVGKNGRMHTFKQTRDAELELRTRVWNTVDTS